MLIRPVRWCILFLVVFSPHVLVAQKKTDAESLAMEGIRLVDEGRVNDGIKLLQEARNLQPAEYDYPLEIGKAHLKTGDAKKAERYLYDLQFHNLVQPELFILLSECYAKLEVGKKNPDESRKKETEALLYGIRKFPDSGELYLTLGHIYQQLEKPLDALAVWEKGIQMAPSYAENYYWAARMLLLTGNHLWAWIYGEVFWNMTDDPELGRAIASNIIISSEKVLSGNWHADPEKTDQDMGFLINEQCGKVSSPKSGIEMQSAMRDCLLHAKGDAPTSLNAFFDRLAEIKKRGWQNIYLAHLYSDQQRSTYISLITQDIEATDDFRKWFFWNRMTPSQPISRLN